MNCPAYPVYKESGVQWLGKVPGHWEVKRLKTSATYKVSNIDKVPNEDELPVRLCNYTDVYYHDQITPNMDLMEATATPQEISRFHLEVDDIVITKDSEDWRDIAVPARIAETAPNLVCGYHLAIISPASKKLYGSYLLRAIQSCAVNQQFQIAASGVTRYGLPKSSIGEAELPLPPLPEQTAIADFLDRETGRIDTLIAKKRRLIALLKEKRTALISRTVTHGLSEAAAREFGLEPHTRFKNSGIEWLGEVPEGWDIIPLGFLTDLKGGATPDKSNVEYWEGPHPWVSPKDMKVLKISDAQDHISSDALQHCSLVLLPENSVLIVVRGMILLHSFPVALTTGRVTINQDMKALICRQKLLPHYLIWVLVGFSKVLVSLTDESAHGTRKIETSTITGFPVLLPGFNEQTVIATYLDRETDKIDHLMAKIEAAIARLQEYRTALITAAVTGKIDVRETVV